MGSFAGFGQRVHWCLAGALRFWVAMCVRHRQVHSYLFLIKFLEASLEFCLLLDYKALYGHPCAGQVWQNKFSKFLIDKVGCK